MKWISNLLSRKSDTLQLPCIVQFAEDDMRMELLEIQLQCGHVGYGVSLFFHLKEQDEWVAIAFIRDFSLDTTLSLLHRAQQCIQNLTKEE